MFIAWKQRWRLGPPTDGQLEFLNKLRSGGKEPLTIENTTKGKASDMITKIKHGARGRFADLESVKRRRERHDLLLEQERERRVRETVSVGPVPV